MEFREPELQRPMTKYLQNIPSMGRSKVTLYICNLLKQNDKDQQPIKAVLTTWRQFHSQAE